MSQLWTPQQAQQQQVAFELLQMPDSSIAIRINGLTVPPLPAEQIIALADNMRAAGEKAIASRAPVREYEHGTILGALG